MCTRTQDRQGTTAWSASRTSLANVPASCVQHARIGYIQDVLVFETLRIIIRSNGWICTACRTPPQPCAPSPPSSPTHHVRQYVQHNTVERQCHRQQTNKTLSIFLEAYNVKVVAIQESKLTTQLRSPNIQNSTLVRQDRRLGPGGGLLLFYP